MFRFILTIASMGVAVAFIGGVDGRALRKGDVLRTFPPGRHFETLEGRQLKPELVPTYGQRWAVRVVLGPQDDLFQADSIATFLNYDWILSNTSDRMGCRFIGPKLVFKPRPDYLVDQAGSDPSNIVDDTIPVGGIRVPSELEPIVLHVDGPSLGGYAKIATVISADLAKWVRCALVRSPISSGSRWTTRWRRCVRLKAPLLSPVLWRVSPKIRLEMLDDPKCS